jgi:hypothetical protein
MRQVAKYYALTSGVFPLPLALENDDLLVTEDANQLTTET